MYPAQRGYLRAIGNFARYQPFGAEQKNLDTTIAAVNYTTAGALAPTAGTINVIAQGDDENQRIGRRVKITKMFIRWDILLPTTAAADSASNTFRTIFYLDKQCNGAAINVTDLLQTASFRSFNNLSNKGRFRILMDKTTTLNSTAGAGDTTNQEYARNRRHYIFTKIFKKPIPIEYNGTTGAIGTIRSNNLGILIISQNTAGTFTATVRLRYVDF